MGADARAEQAFVLDLESNPHPRMLAGVTVLMLAVACVASFLPARRASGVDPIVVLRED